MITSHKRHPTQKQSLQPCQTYITSPKTDLQSERIICFHYLEVQFRNVTKTSGSGSFEVENFRIRKFWAQKPPDPEVLQNWVIKIDDYISQETSYTKTKFTAVSSIRYCPQIDTKLEKVICFHYSEVQFRTVTKTSGSGSFGVENFRIRKFWAWKHPDPEVLSSKTSGSGSFAKLSHESRWLDLVREILCINKLYSRVKHPLLPPKSS